MPLQREDTLVSLEAGRSGTCLTTSSGAGYCWGDFGSRRGEVYRIDGPDGESVGLRSLSTGLCGLSTDGDPWCNRGMTGGWIDSAGNRLSFPAACANRLCISPLPLRGALPAGVTRMVVSGGAHACAIASDAAVYCWGRDGGGKLGTGNWATDRASSGGAMVRAPVAVAGGLRFAKLSAASSVTCGISLQSQFLYCWGHDRKLNPGDSAQIAMPVRIVPEVVKGDHRQFREVRFADLAVGYDLACAASIEGRVYCWGDNYRCALGTCRTGDSSRPRLILVPGRVVEVGVGRWHACARTVDRRLYCWGDNTRGQLGSLVSINAGPEGLPPDHHASGEARDRVSAYYDPCFNGGRCSPTPVEVAPGHRWAALAVGPMHACTLAAGDGGVYCWGGTDTTVLGRGARLVPCINRSPHWPDVRCQPEPTRVPGLPSLAAPSPSITGGLSSRRGPLIETVVTVSARQVRIAFPVDTVGAWGWPDLRYAQLRQPYMWGLRVNGIGGPATIRFRIRRDSAPQSFASLQQLVKEGEAFLWQPEMIQIADTAKVTSKVEGHRLILMLTDSATIARLFGMRPAEVTAYRGSPDIHQAYEDTEITVRYVDPQIPLPDSAARADSARNWRRYEESTTRITRSIAGLEPSWLQLWLAKGDSAYLWIGETECHYDVCYSFGKSVGDSGWSVGDTSIVGIHASCRDATAVSWPRSDRCLIRGVGLGQTTISVRGVHGPSDTAASRSPPATELERTIVVGPPLSRIVLTPRPDTVALDEPVVFQVKVLDRDGQTVNGVPVELTAEMDRYFTTMEASGPVTLNFHLAGERKVFASFRELADTIRVMVVGRKP